MRILKIALTVLMIVILAVGYPQETFVYAVEDEDISAKAAILIEASTGTVLYEKDADLQLAPASVTKVMTLLLIFDALESNKIQLDDIVTTSEYAASMGGSQIFLEAGETQAVETLIKSIVVSSANDACVAMAEYISGSTDAFVEAMNERAIGLGMTNTNFVNCNGLDAEGHLTTARDIALMSQELMNTYPEITEYTMIWTENITHVTSSGSTEFGLSNTNRLVQVYEYTTGLKTGSTDDALFCISATAAKDNVDLIAVIMAAPTSADRSADAITLLNYGFSICQIYEETERVICDDIPIIKGISDTVMAEAAEEFTYLDTEKNDLSMISKMITYEEELEAPVVVGDVVGRIIYMLGDKEIGSVDLVATKDIEAMSFRYAMLELLQQFLL